MLAFHGKQEIKDKYLMRVEAHREADELIKGKYWEGGKGCAVGCTIHSDDHSAYERDLGIPSAIAYLEDRIFENLPNGKSKEWPEKFLKAIPVGADLSLVTSHFMIWLVAAEAEVWVADQAARPAVWAAHYEKMAEKCLELLRNAPIKELVNQERGEKEGKA